MFDIRWDRDLRKARSGRWKSGSSVARSWGEHSWRASKLRGPRSLRGACLPQLVICSERLDPDHERSGQARRPQGGERILLVVAQFVLPFEMGAMAHQLAETCAYIRK